MARGRPPWPYHNLPQRTPLYVPEPGEPEPWTYLYFDPRQVPPVPKSWWGRLWHRFMWG